MSTVDDGDSPAVVTEAREAGGGQQEAEVWEEFWETDAARCCSCPSCNYYALDYEAHKDEPCLLQTLIESILTARLAQVTAELAAARNALAACPEVREQRASGGGQ